MIREETNEQIDRDEAQLFIKGKQSERIICSRRPYVKLETYWTISLTLRRDAERLMR